MISVLSALLQGDKKMASMFAEAREFWADFFEQHRDGDLGPLATALERSQTAYRAIFKDDAAMAKETMPYTCLGCLYDESAGFEDRDLAIRTAKAFLQAKVSIEVQVFAKEAIALFGLNFEDDQLYEVVRAHFSR